MELTCENAVPNKTVMVGLVADVSQRITSNVILCNTSNDGASLEGTATHVAEPTAEFQQDDREQCVSGLLHSWRKGLAGFCTVSDTANQSSPLIRICVSLDSLDDTSGLIDAIAALRSLKCEVTVFRVGDRTPCRLE